MTVIADSNIFYSALITPNGYIATILKDKNLQFLAPDYIIDIFLLLLKNQANIFTKKDIDS